MIYLLEVHDIMSYIWGVKFQAHGGYGLGRDWESLAYDPSGWASRGVQYKQTNKQTNKQMMKDPSQLISAVASITPIISDFHSFSLISLRATRHTFSIESPRKADTPSRQGPIIMTDTYKVSLP